MLEVIGLACSRNDRELFSKLSFRLPSGLALHLRAANGLGKTTLLKTILGILPLTVGKIICCSRAIYIGHKTNLHPALSPLQNLQFVHAISETDASQDKQALTEALAFTALTAQQDLSCDELSSGQCQRLNLARLYLTSAKLWLLDEPFINLDAEARILLIELCTKHLVAGGSILIATHYDLELPNIQTLNLENYV